MCKTLGLALVMALATISGAWADSEGACWITDSAASAHGLWLLCQEGALYLSTDQGKTWQSKQLPAGEEFRAMAFIDDRRGFVVGEDGTLLATDDGGSNWRKVDLGTTENLTSVHFVGDKGWVSGYRGLIYHTEDAGKTWSEQKSGVSQGLENIYFLDADHGWAVGWVGTLTRTIDGGRTWIPTDIPDEFWTLNSVLFRDKDNGWIVGFEGRILRSHDGGQTWMALKSPVDDALSSVEFDHAGRGWITADDKLLTSDDGGETWRIIPIEDSIFAERIQPVGDTLWVIGKLGLLKKTGPAAAFKSFDAPGGLSWLQTEEHALVEKTVKEAEAIEKGHP